MTSASEVFVLQLSRASQRANRFLRSRNVRIDDRNDVIATALLWCWDNRGNYSLTVTLDQWFLGAVRNAYKAWQANEVRHHTETMAEIPTGDTTLAETEAWSSARALIGSLPHEYRRVAVMEMQGLTRAEMMEKGASKDTIDNARARIKQLRRLLPDTHEYRRVLRTAPTTSNYEGGEENQSSRIDQEIAALDFPPGSGKECPPCWRCKYFDGYLPGAHRSIRLPIQEAEVRDAVRDTEARKIGIAERVRAGTINQ